MNLFNHQQQAVDFILSRGGSGAIFHEMGLGKTRTALEIFLQLAFKDDDLKMIVFAPLSLLEAAWTEDAKRFLPNAKIWNIHKNEFPESVHVWNANNIYVINYEKLISESYRQSVKRLCGSGNWVCILDESSRIKNHQSQTTKIILKMAPLFKYRVVMSGTPAPNSEMEYWPQMQFVAPGSLGTSMTAFRSHFFHLVNRYSKQTVTPTFTSRAQAAEIFRKCDYRITAEKRDELMRFIMPHCHIAKKKDCLDLPDQVDEVRLVEMEGGQRSAYYEMKKNLVIQIRDQQIAAPLALTKLMKLRQITSGFIYNEFGNALNINFNSQRGASTSMNETVEKEFSNPKLKELFDIIEEAGDQPIIIWIQFHWEQIKICHELYEKFGEQSVVTLSAITKDKDGSIKAFQEGRARFLVAHPASAAHGLTFVNCSLEVFFSLDFSAEKYAQAKARIHRAGQTKKCTYVHILCKGTIDEDIYAALNDKINDQELLYRIMMGKSGGVV